MTRESAVLWRIKNGVGHIVLNRPQAANAIDSKLTDDIVRVISTAIRSDVRAILLSSTGRQFCSGGDINELAGNREQLGALLTGLLERLNPAIHALATAPIPVISAVQGPVGGAGIAMALCADLVLATPEMKLRGGYSAIGLSPDLGASYYLARRAGPSRAKLIFFTNRVLQAEECLRWGIIDEIHPSDCLQSAACKLAEELAQGATYAFGSIKRLCDSAYEHDLTIHLDLEGKAMVSCGKSKDGQEGAGAFVEKRLPNFSGARWS